MKNLLEIWNELAQQGYETDKGSVHDYISVYEKVLAPYRHAALNVLEVGLFAGHSLRMWETYFAKAKVHGIDCDEQPHGGLADLRPMIAEGTHLIHIMDAGDMGKVKETFGDIKFDVIIEDTTHNSDHQQWLYEVYKDYLSPNGIYIIEDIENIDRDLHLFENIDSSKHVEIIDRRFVANRFDDVLVIIRDKP